MSISIHSLTIKSDLYNFKPTTDWVEYNKQLLYNIMCMWVPILFADACFIPYMVYIVQIQTIIELQIYVYTYMYIIYIYIYVCILYSAFTVSFTCKDGYKVR